VERDAKYATVAIFALLAVAAAFAFVWWYTGKGDRRVYERFEIYFDGSVSGLSQGSPVRYLGVDVGRVHNLRVGSSHPGRVKVVADIDSTAPITTATRARLGLLGMTGLLYIDLQVDPAVNASGSLIQGDRYPIIRSQKGDIEAFLQSLPDVVSQVGRVLERVERLFADENLAAVNAALESLQETLAELPELGRDAAGLMAELHKVSVETAELAASLRGLVESAAPAAKASLKNMSDASERLAGTAVSLERILTKNEATLSQFAGTGLVEMQQLMIDLREVSVEVQGLARSLQDNPSSLLLEEKESGVEIAR
jgi:phospholipid/cholesterol/gamma-HCH transport system substrate-binding protein